MEMLEGSTCKNCGYKTLKSHDKCPNCGANPPTWNSIPIIPLEKYRIDTRVELVCRTEPNKYLSRTRIAKALDLPFKEVKESVERLLAEGKLKHQWVGYDGFRSIDS